MENQRGKYLKYAIGEISLVLISILIALQLNNWNANRLEKVQEVKYLKNIKKDLELNMPKKRPPMYLLETFGTY
jgi:hypothetical protein